VASERQLVRQWHLYFELCNAREPLSALQFSRLLNCSKSTIVRDINDPTLSGFEVLEEERENTTYYFVHKKKSQLLLNFTPAEVMALYLYRNSAPPLAHTPYGSELNTAIAKIESALPEGVKMQLDNLAKKVIFHRRGYKDYSKEGETVDKVNRALVSRNVCTIEYHAASGKKSVYDIHPLRIFHHDGALYLYVRVPKHDTLNTLAVERIKKITLKGETFEEPQVIDFEKDFDNPFGLVGGKARRIEVWFSRQTALYVRERVWHPTQKIKENRDGSIIFTMNAAGWHEIIAWVLSFGANAEVIRPLRLRQEVRDIIQLAGKRYGGWGCSAYSANIQKTASYPEAVHT
jgi:proteasome accessory factor B